MWFYFDHILVPFQTQDAAEHDHPRGNLSDLYPRWLGARELLLHGRDPYSSEITREIQIGYYGRALDPARSDEPKDQAAFAYPVYVVFLLAPTVTMSFHQAQEFFLVCLLGATMFGVVLWLRALRWHPSKELAATFTVLFVGSLPAMQGIKLQQLTLLVAAMLAACFAALAAGYFSLAGILLALSTIKPQLAFLPVMWLLTWGAWDWQNRKRLVIAWALTMATLLLGAEALLPGWVGRFRAALAAYHVYTSEASLPVFLFSPLAGYALTAILLLITAIVCCRFLGRENHSSNLAASGSLVLALVVVIVPKIALYNQVLLLPALLLMAQKRRLLWRGTSLSRILLVLSAILLFWPWLAALALDFALLVFPASLVQSKWQLPFYTILALPLLVFATVVLILLDSGQSAKATSRNQQILRSF